MKMCMVFLVEKQTSPNTPNLKQDRIKVFEIVEFKSQ